ncbi:AAA family ATPase [Actinomadura rupiterrae]|uniref:AAA family ATPase n=1 Tax=Actinomadura rupiterrae TaxID=559627 RepID=UPI0020A361BA|nr:LuxR family transcriptional regulator [Actinomadura rupiterrae]MCP2343700.1 DNA-binding CsgD family transcriptional regulator [Actinomadura rupiterrae]
MLYGRDTEQDRIGELLDDARDNGRSSVLLLRGEAGIGKSALLDWAAETCAHERVLRATGYEAERDIAFGGLNQLLWPVRDRVDALPDPQAEALRTALGLGDVRESAGGRGDRFGVGLGLLTLLADLAEDGPVLCLVDDAQWLDAASAEALLFAVRRLAAEGVVVLLAARDEGLLGSGLPELALGRLETCDALRVLEDRGLAADAVHRVLAEAEGNPLALLEFGAARPNASGVLPVADRVLAAFRDQIAALPEPTRELLLIAASEGRGHLPSVVRAAASFGLGLDDLAEAERLRMVEVTGTAVRFRHPLIRAAAYQRATTAHRITVHQALAMAADDPECQVRHRAAAAMGPDEDVAADLQASAERARGKAGIAVVAGLYRQSAALSPDSDTRAARLAAAADAVLAAGSPEQAEETAHEAAVLTSDPVLLARLARVRAAVEVERGNGRSAATLLLDHAEQSAPSDRQWMLRAASAYAWTSGDASSVQSAASRLSDDAFATGLAALTTEDYATGLPLLARAVREGGPDALHAAVILGDDEQTLDLATTAAAAARRLGQIGALPGILEALATVQIALGLHADAEASATEALALSRDTGLWRGGTRIAAVLTRLAAIEGNEAYLAPPSPRQADPGGPLDAGGPLPRPNRLTLASESCGTPAVVPPPPLPAPPLTGPLRGRDASADAVSATSHALLDLGLGRHDEAVRRLEDVFHGPHRHSAIVMGASPDLIEAALRADRPDLAASAHARFTRWATASGQAWARAAALRAEALLHDTEAPFAAALDLHDQALRPFEKARTELAYGEWLRRNRRRSDARARLHSALEAFERLRAAPWASRVRTELRASGEGTVPSAPAAASLLDRLTPQELQVVKLAAEGISSREIAAQLFLSPRTVEYHLYKAYPKLGISSRRDLPHLPLPA